MTARRRFGRIRRLPSKRYQVRHLDGAGRLVTAPQTFATKTDADRYLAAVETDQGRGRWTDPRLSRLAFGEWVEEWWATTTNLRPSTRERDRGYLERYVLPAFASSELGGVSQLDVRSWVARLDASGLAPATVQKAYQLLGKVFAAAIDGGLIGETPCRRVPLPRIEREEMRFLSPAEVARLVEAMDPRYKCLVEVGAYGGLRIGELGGLRRSRVDLLRRRLEVAEIAVEVRGEITYGPPKTKAGRRWIGLPPQVADRLGAHLGSWAGSEFVFPAPEGGPLRPASWRRRFWHPATAAAGLAGLRPHDLRHTAVALWIAQGANPKQIAARAGHASVSFTLDRYGHLFPDADEELMTRLDAAYVPPEGHGRQSEGARGGHAAVSALRPETAT